MSSQSTLANTTFLQRARQVSKALIDFATSLKGITDASVVINESEKFKIEVEKGQLTSSTSGNETGISVRIYAGDKSLAFSTNTLDVDDLKQTVLENAQNIHLVPDNPDLRLTDPKHIYSGPVVDYDLADTNDIKPDQLVDYTKRVEAAAQSHPGVKGVRKVSGSKSASRFFKTATNGLEVHDVTTAFTVGAHVVAQDNQGMEISGEGAVVRHFEDLPEPEELGKKAAQKAVSKLGSVMPVTGKVPVILSHEAAETLLDSVIQAIDGGNVHRETTFLKDKIGQKVMCDEFTLIDDPTILRGISSGLVDTAGMKQDPVTFIENGVLKSFNMSYKEALQLGRDPIGRNNGPTNLIVMPGSKSPQELMADIDDGIYIEAFAGGVASANTGDFSRQAEGRAIKNGHVTDQAVSGFVVAGNLKDMFMNVVLANDTPQLPDPYEYQTAVPTMRLDGLTISGG